MPCHRCTARKPIRPSPYTRWRHGTGFNVGSTTHGWTRYALPRVKSGGRLVKSWRFSFSEFDVVPLMKKSKRGRRRWYEAFWMLKKRDVGQGFASSMMQVVRNRGAPGLDVGLCKLKIEYPARDNVVIPSEELNWVTANPIAAQNLNRLSFIGCSPSLGIYLPGGLQELRIERQKDDSTGSIALSELMKVLKGLPMLRVLKLHWTVAEVDTTIDIGREGSNFGYLEDIEIIDSPERRYPLLRWLISQMPTRWIVGRELEVRFRGCDIEAECIALHLRSHLRIQEAARTYLDIGYRENIAVGSKHLEEPLWVIRLH